jgi:regulator of sirC expression with transglutaminase-like and TPR domain
MNLTKVKAIVNLLEDPSSEVQTMMKAQLKQMSMSELVELCEKSRDINLDISLRLEEVRKEKSFDFCVLELEHLVSSKKIDMESMAIFLSRVIDSSVKAENVKSSLDALTQRCQDYLDTHFDENKGEVLARFLAVEEGFTGNKKQYYAVGNSSLSCLLETKQALPITLSALYIILGERLGINVKGIAIPAHFIVGIYDEAGAVTYVNPFDSGKIMSLDHCRALTRRAGHPFTEEVMEPVDSRPIFLRMLTNLKFIYSREAKKAEAKNIMNILKIWAEKVFKQVP